MFSLRSHINVYIIIKIDKISKKMKSMHPHQLIEIYKLRQTDRLGNLYGDHYIHVVKELFKNMNEQNSGLSPKVSKATRWGAASQIMKPMSRIIDDNISKQTVIVYQKISRQYKDKFVEFAKLRHKGKLGNMRGNDYIHMVVMYFRGMANRVS